MVVDRSTTIAILRDEPEAGNFARAIESALSVLISAVSMVEARLVLAGRHGDTLDWRSLALLALDAFLRFGKGRHPAALNMGDCASYALARSRDAPLLFKGQDFARTDIRAAALS